MINKDRLVKHFLDYVQIDSESRNEYNFAKHLEEQLIQLGFEVSFDQVGEKIGGNCGNLIARKKGNVEGCLFLSAHMDTVKPGVGIKPIVLDDMITSDGTTILGGDDKGGVASIMEVVTALIEDNATYPDIEILFAVAEEVGLLGSRYLEPGLLKATMGYVLDSSKPVGTIVNSAPSQTNLNVIVKGKPAHAGTQPEKGISAIMIASRAINNMKLLRIDEETTANIGIVEGGKATNIVMPELMIKAEARSLNDDKLNIQVKHMVETLEEAATYYGGQVDIEILENYKTYTVDETIPSVKKAIKAFERLNMTYILQPTGGGSDVNNHRENGLDCVNLGIAMTNCHTLQECIKISDMLHISQMVYNLITHWEKDC